MEVSCGTETAITFLAAIKIPNHISYETGAITSAAHPETSTNDGHSLSACLFRPCCVHLENHIRKLETLWTRSNACGGPAHGCVAAIIAEETAPRESGMFLLNLTKRLIGWVVVL